MAKVIYFIPHQDDEVLSMGVSIATHVEAGHDVQVVLCSDGQSSGVRTELNNGGSCKKNVNGKQDTHNINLSEGAGGGFVSARDREFINACLKLGIKYSNIIIPKFRVKDSYGKENFSGAVKQFEEIVYRHIQPGARVKCITPYGGELQHMDHKALGEAVKNCCEEIEITDIRYYIDPYYLSSYEQDKGGPYSRECAEKSSVLGKTVISAAKEYGQWKPEEPDYSYAIGWHSGYGLFQDCIGNTSNHGGKPTNYVHRP